MSSNTPCAVVRDTLAHGRREDEQDRREAAFERDLPRLTDEILSDPDWLFGEALAENGIQYPFEPNLTEPRTRDLHIRWMEQYRQYLADRIKRAYEQQDAAAIGELLMNHIDGHLKETLAKAKERA